MSRKTRKKKRMTTVAQAKRRTRISQLSGWAPVALLLFVTGLAVAFRGIGADTSKTTTTLQSERATNNQPNLTPETEVLAYLSEKNSWQNRQLKELERGREFLLDNQLFNIGQSGLTRMNPRVNVALLSEADRYFDENNSRFPESNDIVRFVDQDRNHLRHDRMITANPGALFYFQGRLFETSATTRGAEFISVRKTGTVLRPPYYSRSYDDEEIDSRTWRSIHLEKKEADGSLTVVDLLRPTWWLDQHQASEGGGIYLDLAEMGAIGQFEVKSIDPCPERKPGPVGTRAVIGKFAHENAVVLDLHFEGESRPFGVTANHPIWSETHQEYLPAGEFKVGEEARSLNGPARLLEVTQRPGRHTVYNLEVHKDHIYRIGASGILVHNKGPEDVVTFFRGSTRLDVAEAVQDNAINLKRIAENQRLAGHPLSRQGVFLTSQESTARYYADLAGGSGRGLGPATMRIEIPRSQWEAFAAKHRIEIEAPVPRSPLPGQTETLIPQAAADEFNSIINIFEN